MAQRKIKFSEEEYYHLYNRGNSKQEIFLDDDDRCRFTKMLYLCNSIKNINFRDDIVERKIDAWDFDKGKNIVSIGAWVMMSNHFHILLRISPTSDIGEESISYYMKKLCTSYSKYFNKKYERTGGLFESNFKATHVDSDNYLKYLFSYIHLNPIKKVFPEWKSGESFDHQEAKDFLKKYYWSSYQDYAVNNRKESQIMSTKDFPEYFLDKTSFGEEIYDWLSFTPMSDIGDSINQ